MDMTPRQLRRIQQKAERKAAKKLTRQQHAEQTSTQQNPARSATEQGERLAAAPSPAPGHISEAKLTANRANAQLSTGPVSSAGKAISSQNRTRHGLSGSMFRVMPDESQAKFDQLLESILRDQQPINEEEVEMVHQMAEALWLSRRAVHMQNECLVKFDLGDPNEQKAAHKQLTLFLRYQTAHDRTFFRYSAELRKRRNERYRVVRGFESQKLRAAQETRKQEAHHIRQAIDKRKQERHEMSLRVAQAKLEHQQQHETAPEPQFQTTAATEPPASTAAAA